jgi:putative acetyltransferase
MAGTRREDDVVIRERQPADDVAIRRLNEAAFGGTYEATLIEDLRPAGLAALELVACEEAEITGHILFSRLDATLDGRPIRALAPGALAGAKGQVIYPAAFGLGR